MMLNKSLFPEDQNEIPAALSALLLLSFPPKHKFKISSIPAV